MSSFFLATQISILSFVLPYSDTSSGHRQLLHAQRIGSFPAHLLLLLQSDHFCKHRDISPYLYQPHALRNSSLSGTVRAEPVGVLTEFCFTYRLHDLQNTLLYDPIYDSWNSQRSGLSIGLWYLHSPYGSWMIITELFPYETDVFFLA